MKELPTLYKKSGNSIRTWRVWARGWYVFTEFGTLNGKLQKSETMVRGKNAGRSNQTNDFEQAIVHANQLHRKKIKQGFLADRCAAHKTDNALGGPQPMLALKFEDYEDSVTFPCYVQPKLDGIRCLAQVKNGVATLYTRSQKLITTVPHIKEAVEKLSATTRIKDFALDGEIYNHEFCNDFGKILGMVKRKETAVDSKVVHYCCYDLIDLGMKFQERTTTLRAMMTCGHERIPGLVFVDTVHAHDLDDLRAAQQRFVQAKYEGAMYRSINGLYTPAKRSRDLLKMKIFDDAEFEIIGTHEGKGKLRGLVGSWICVTEEGVQFRAKQVGALDKIIKFNSPTSYKLYGKQLTVKFQGYTPDGSPRFPRAIKFKDALEA
jgi:DNA ligase-1